VVKCPAYNKQVPLAYYNLYDGPPGQLVDIMGPDFSHGKGGNEYGYTGVNDVFDSHHALYVVCGYGDWNSKNAITIKIDSRVNRRYYRSHPKGQPLKVWCK
jgi:hypothetical protein